jgi:hypothetical protein
MVFKASVLVVWGMQVLFAVALAGANVAILHQIPEGHVGVYWRGGALLKTITGPGITFLNFICSNFL